ncbi:aldose epimerase family protein [Cypionkella sp.]|uniref:aldose epimerase family protein n=1 Tax=Cypionkella sp. TaxID=2811411 RepID=UPI002ABCE7EB|nr:aldose epimerase family protein [Cypionkella sp.]MDZ4392305.1 aldose epimerase family protein [Cypionkella sp.]
MDTQVFTISDGADCSAVLSPYGARLMQLWAPGRGGVLADIVLGHDDVQGYLDHPGTYFGATCGRYANRIADGRFDWPGGVVQLDCNEGVNHLHGGARGFDKRVWQVLRADARGVTFGLHSPDGEMGFPGDLDVEARYEFTGPARLQIEMTARAAADTVVNLVNHAYFNMAGQGSGVVDSQLLQIDADRYLPVDAALLPLGAPADVAGTPFDFRELRELDADVPAGGFDHNFCLNGGVGPAVVAVDPVSGRGLRLFTNQPGVQLYTGSYLPEGLPGKAGAVTGARAGFTLETQVWPDGPNHADYPSAVVVAGGVYRHEMEFAFFVAD